MHGLVLLIPDKPGEERDAVASAILGAVIADGRGVQLVSPNRASGREVQP